MNKKFGKRLPALIGVSLLILAVSVSPSPLGASFAEKPKSNRVVEGNTAFALDLYRELKDDTKGNLFFSPYSISTALAMTYAGARANTGKQMAEVLHFSAAQKELHPAFAKLEAVLRAAQPEGKIQLIVANSLWPQKGYPFLDEYLALVKKHYGVTVTPLDYQGAAAEAGKIINRWVEEKTKDKIKDLVQPGVLNALTRLVLVNAIYFKGNWASRFDEKRTRDEPFYLLPGKTVQTKLMAKEAEFGYGEDGVLHVLELPYEGETLSLVVLLPKEKDGLPGLETQLNPANLMRWTSNLNKQKVKVFLPKFKLTSQFSLGRKLAAMGMPDAFDMNRADFSGMDGRDWLYIGAVVHKAFVEVNEEGTEAAAATAVVMRVKMAAPTPIPTFRADHPFIFFIRENTTGSILFLGRVLDPNQTGD